MLADPGFLEHFHFLRPAWALLPIPWLAVLWMMRKRQSSRDAFGGIIAPHLLHHLRLNRFRSNWINPQNFTTALFLILLIVLMGPSWRQQPSPLSQDDAALVILLDISASMTQRDVQPSRLRRAKQKVEDLLALRPDKLTSLIVYAGSAHTVLTLTADRAILTQYLAAIEPDIMPRAGKFPEYALVQVDKVLRQSQAPATVVIFADGTGADSRREFSDYFSSRDHQLLVVGVGTQADDERLVPLERESLQALASAASGSYRDLTVDDSDMRWVNRQINSHYLVVQDSALPWLDSGYMLVFPALGLFLMWFRRGWTLTWSWLLVPWLLVQSPGPLQASDTSPAEVKSHWFADQWLTADQQGRILMYRGHYREAARRFDNPTWKAMAYYYAEDFMQA
ncbi:MAG: VWA domain-containing protein, partial [Halieaceae bacterium]|nr:VWA domain-containing protein [Halieaceae bacterium]